MLYDSEVEQSPQTANTRIMWKALVILMSVSDKGAAGYLHVLYSSTLVRQNLFMFSQQIVLQIFDFPMRRPTFRTSFLR